MTREMSKAWGEYWEALRGTCSMKEAWNHFLEKRRSLR